LGRDGTEYKIGLLPFGGYVRLVDAREGEVSPADRRASFQGRPVWARILMLLAGPGANFLFALLAFWVLFLAGVPGLRPVVGEVRAGAAAAVAGLRSGDELLAVDNSAVATREAALLAMISGVVRDGELALRVRGVSGGERILSLVVPPAQRLGVTEPGAWSAGFGFQFTRPLMPPVIGAVVPGQPAERAGLRAGDVLVRVAGAPVADFEDVVAQIAPRPGAALRLEFRRGTTVQGVELVPAAVQDGPRTVGRIGITPGVVGDWPPGMETREQYGPLAAVGPALRETWGKSALTLKFLTHMFTGSVSVKNISGPISIATAAGVTALEGPGYYLQFLAVISLSLAVLNLLPVPVLDGGQVVFQLAELLKGKPLSERVQQFGQQAGMALLVLLMGLAFYNDIARHFG
jgi:regulator of sigma E protease